jgi:hypothetical protein
MTKELDPISFNEFSKNLTGFFEQVIRESKPVVVENDKGERAILKPIRSVKRKSRPRTAANHQAFLAAAGGWKDVDTDKFLIEY